MGHDEAEAPAFLEQPKRALDEEGRGVLSALADLVMPLEKRLLGRGDFGSVGRVADHGIEAGF
ncbi:hypothetical protein D3C72_2150670 [compost metagenome]